MNTSKRLLAIGGITVGLIAALIWLRGPYAQLAARHWRSELETVDDDRVAAVLDQAAALGNPGTAVLVEALGSRRRGVARAGKAALLQRFERWEMLSSAAASKRLALLADVLAKRVDRFGPDARADAADLATRILVWPLDAEAVDAADVIASCEKVLRAASVPADVVVVQPATSGDLVEAATLPPPDLPTPGTERMSPGVSIADAARLPGGDLPIRPFSPAEPPEESSAESRVADARLAPPRRLSPPPAQPIGPERAPESPVDNGAEAPPAAAPPPIRPLSLQEPGELAGLDTAPLMRMLQDPGEPVRAMVAAELTRRGFTLRQIELGRRLFDPDAEVRRQLARLLPAEPGIDAAPWLLLLSRDPAADVRLTAIALLATTADATLIDRLEQIARTDADPRVRRQAERLARQQTP